MLRGIWAIAVLSSLGAGPFGVGRFAGHGSSIGSFPETISQTGIYAVPAVSGVYVDAGPGGFGDQLYRFDDQEPWKHGYFQVFPANGGYHAFRPYNYKHVLTQSRAAAAWGMSPGMPYSQQFWHRYHQRATMQRPESVRQRRNDPESGLRPRSMEKRHALPR